MHRKKIPETFRILALQQSLDQHIHVRTLLKAKKKKSAFKKKKKIEGRVPSFLQYKFLLSFGAL